MILRQQLLLQLAEDLLQARLILCRLDADERQDHGLEARVGDERGDLVAPAAASRDQDAHVLLRSVCGGKQSSRAPAERAVRAAAIR